MKELLEEEFVDHASGAPRFKRFWDCGIEVSLLNAVSLRLGMDEVKQELDELYDFLAGFIAEEMLEYRQLEPGPIPELDLHKFRVSVLAPDAGRVFSLNGKRLGDILDCPKPEFQATKETFNSVSAVLVLTSDRYAVSLVLGGDATAKSWRRALAHWGEEANRTEWSMPTRQARFAGVKVSHHGAKDGLYAPLYEAHCRQDGAVAVVSTIAHDPRHPHPDVIHALRSAGLSVYLTCQTDADEADGTLFFLPGASGEHERGQHRTSGDERVLPDVVVNVWSDGSVTAEPEAKLVAVG
ncbi:hypothetical protein ACFL6X_01240 [Candidatus Latescibacterota bacterium]